MNSRLILGISFENEHRTPLIVPLIWLFHLNNQPNQKSNLIENGLLIKLYSRTIRVMKKLLDVIILLFTIRRVLLEFLLK